MTARHWTATAERLPREGVVVEVLCSGYVLLMFTHNGWWFRADKTWVNFTPTHWRERIDM